jgi:hypothetical protein
MEHEAAELAREIQNPVAALISVPIEGNWDFGAGPARATSYTANTKPVVPFSLSQDWNLITRTIVPLISAESPERGGGSATGLGDVAATVYFSPSTPVGGWFMGVGRWVDLPQRDRQRARRRKVERGPNRRRAERDGRLDLRRIGDCISPRVASAVGAGCEGCPPPRAGLESLSPPRRRAPRATRRSPAVAPAPGVAAGTP